MDKGKSIHTVVNHPGVVSDERRDRVAAPHTTSARITTLYNLMTAMQDAACPDEEALIVQTIAQWLRSGRITFHGDIGGLIRECTLS
jgi:hypothetical protein